MYRKVWNVEVQRTKWSVLDAFRQCEIPSKFLRVYSVKCQFDFQDSKNVLVPKRSPVKCNQCVIETSKWNIA